MRLREDFLFNFPFFKTLPFFFSHSCVFNTLLHHFFLFKSHYVKWEQNNNEKRKSALKIIVKKQKTQNIIGGINSDEKDPLKLRFILKIKNQIIESRKTRKEVTLVI